VWPHIATALDALRAEHDVVVIEGAGSPAEINLMDSDIVNPRVARHADARCLLVTDIDKGGAFAHLYGTWALLPVQDQQRIQGFVLNKFRGDASLLAPAPEQLQILTGVPTVATLPMWWQHGLPQEDGVFDARSRSTGASPALWLWWPIRASATWMSSNHFTTCPACACCGHTHPLTWRACSPPIG
jgi:adenosylcobyric acid synthase